MVAHMVPPFKVIHCLPLLLEREPRLALARNLAGQTPLHLAAHSNLLSVRILLEHGADINTEDNLGTTPLEAAWYSSLNTLEIGRYCCPKAATEKATEQLLLSSDRIRTVLMAEGAKCRDYLIEKGANIERLDNQDSPSQGAYLTLSTIFWDDQTRLRGSWPGWSKVHFNPSRTAVEIKTPDYKGIIVEPPTFGRLMLLGALPISDAWGYYFRISIAKTSNIYDNRDIKIVVFAWIKREIEDGDFWGNPHEYEDPEQVFAFSSNVGALVPESNIEYHLTLGRMCLKKGCDLALEARINGEPENSPGCIILDSLRFTLEPFYELNFSPTTHPRITDVQVTREEPVDPKFIEVYLASKLQPSARGINWAGLWNLLVPGCYPWQDVAQLEKRAKSVQAVFTQNRHDWGLGLYILFAIAAKISPFSWKWYIFVILIMREQLPLKSRYAIYPHWNYPSQRQIYIKTLIWIMMWNPFFIGLIYCWKNTIRWALFLWALHIFICVNTRPSLAWGKHFHILGPLGLNMDLHVALLLSQLFPGVWWLIGLFVLRDIVSERTKDFYTYSFM